MKKLKKAMAMGLTALSMASGVKMGATNIQTTQTSSESSINLGENGKNGSKQEISERTRWGVGLANLFTGGVTSFINTNKPAKKTIASGIMGVVSMFATYNLMSKAPGEAAMCMAAFILPIPVILLTGAVVGNVYNFVETVSGNTQDENNKPIKK